MKDFVIKYLAENLSPLYKFHNDEHTLYVAEKVVEIGREENCNDYELDLLVAAALWHDTGYVISYFNHEEESCKLLKMHVPRFGYTDDEIDLLCEIIMATQIPQTPTGKLGEIIADADLEYLGTSRAEEISCRLYQEMMHIRPEMTVDEWNQVQVDFLENHQYFTDYCRRFKEPVKQAYLEKVKSTLV